MISSIVLDILLVIIVLMMVPLGFLRGGLREVCTSAGILLGILMAQQWAPRWSDSVSELLGTSPATALFFTTGVILVACAVLFGYGGSAAFSWKPGPGGRMYGAYLALLNALIVIGFLINSWVIMMNGGNRPIPLAKSWVARALSGGFHWVLLLACIGLIGATIFGMFVRERGDESAFTSAPTADEFYRIQHRERAPDVRPLDPDDASKTPASPVRIREVRHWEEDESQQTAVTPAAYGTGWKQTWPGDDGAKPWQERASQGTPPRNASKPRPRSNADSRKDTLRDFVSDDVD